MVAKSETVNAFPWPVVSHYDYVSCFPVTIISIYNQVY